MSAIDTTSRVIEWAVMSLEGRQAPPHGTLQAIEQLAHPPVALRKALGRLTALTTARLRFGVPPLQDHALVGVGALILAAALGAGGSPELARLLLRVVPAPSSPVEWVARHGIVAPALRFLSEVIADDCRLASPLTAVLDRPAAGQDAMALDVLQQLMAHTAERVSLTLQLARPRSEVAVRQWRHAVLDRLRLGSSREQNFVLDVYETMIIHHQHEALAQVRAARAVITDAVAVRDDSRLQEALSVSDWWGPLWALERANAGALRARRYLGYTYREGIALFQLARKLTKGMS